MKVKELKGLSEEEKKKRLEELRKELIKHRAQIATGTIPKSPGQVKQTKKTIAKILTFLKEKEAVKKEKRSQKSETVSEKKQQKEEING
ncbi:50S ribosomal protein L29 [Candidatus Woesearchaeota archaeon]|nr:50S ribosomal protein L29 [Candidatus Woesearchaeota archaeon]